MNAEDLFLKKTLPKINERLSATHSDRGRERKDSLPDSVLDTPSNSSPTKKGGFTFNPYTQLQNSCVTEYMESNRVVP